MKDFHALAYAGEQVNLHFTCNNDEWQVQATATEMGTDPDSLEELASLNQSLSKFKVPDCRFEPKQVAYALHKWSDDQIQINDISDKPFNP